ncbi:MAG: hypothetical protein Q7S44_03150 [bacterium]|nr:hypothetical protein [bacterium]
MNLPSLKYRRVLLKLSGELLGGSSRQGVDFEAVETISQQLINIKKETGVELAIVVGGGNIFRGRSRGSKVDEATADYMGMLATVIRWSLF